MRQAQGAEGEAEGEAQGRLYLEDSRLRERMGEKEVRDTKFRKLSEFIYEQLREI